MNPSNDFQTQADEKSRPSRKSRNSRIKPNVEKKMEVGNKSLSLIPNEENIDNPTDVAIIENNLKEDLLNSDLMSVHEEKKQRFFCSICNKSYSDNYSLKRHIENVHEGIKPEILPPKRRRLRLNYGVINEKGFKDECLFQTDNPTNDIQNQTNEKPRTPSYIEPIAEEMKVVEIKNISIIPDGENIDSSELEINPLGEYEKTMDPDTNDEIMSSENESIKQSLRINTEANQVHPLFGTKIHALSRSSLPSKLQIINIIRFKIDSTTKKHYSRKEKNKMYGEVAKEIISIWREAYIVCFDEKCVTDKIKRNIIPLMVAETYRKFPNEERKNDKLLELKQIFDIARCPCFRYVKRFIFSYVLLSLYALLYPGLDLKPLLLYKLGF